MTCAEFEERIARYVGGDLTPREAAEVEQHLRACAECAELARGLEEDREWLARRPPETADVDFTAMRREIRREIARPRWAWRWLAAAAAVLVLVGLASMVRRTPAPRQVVPITQVDHSLARQSASTVAALKERAVDQKEVVAQKAMAVGGKRVSKRKIQPLTPEPDQPVEIRIATRDPNVTIILVHEIKGVTQ